MSVQCCVGIICTMVFLRDEKGDRYHREVFLEPSYNPNLGRLRSS